VISADEMAQIQKGDDEMRFDFGLNGHHNATGASVSGNYLGDDFDATTALDDHEPARNGQSKQRNGYNSESSVANGTNGTNGSGAYPLDFEQKPTRRKADRSRYQDDLDLV